MVQGILPRHYIRGFVKQKKDQLLSVNQVTAENQYEMLADVVNPYWNKTYEEQFQIKEMFVQRYINMLQKKTNLPNGRVKLRSMIESPLRTEYRNVDEFSIGIGIDGNPKTVGYFYGKPSLTTAFCIHPDNLKSIKPQHVKISRLLEEYLTQSTLPASCKRFDGFWKTLIVYSNGRGDAMVIVKTISSYFPEARVIEESIKLRDFMVQKEPNLTLYHLICPLECSTPTIDQFKLLYGHPYLYEYIGKYKFRILPTTKFHSNVGAKELMYNEVLDLAGLSEDTIVLDLCCGSGTVSILASDKVHGSIGIDKEPNNIKEAEINAKINDVTNCNFISSNLEYELSILLGKISHWTSIAVVLSPGHYGVSNEVINILLRHFRITRVIYISPSLDSRDINNNLITLQTSVHDSFQLTEVVPVDISPFTKYIEMILVFKRR